MNKNNNEIWKYHTLNDAQNIWIEHIKTTYINISTSDYFFYYDHSKNEIQIFHLCNQYRNKFIVSIKVNMNIRDIINNKLNEKVLPFFLSTLPYVVCILKEHMACSWSSDTTST